MHLHKIKTVKGYELAAYVLEAAHFSNVIIIAPATGVRQTFYHELAKWLNEIGITVITFDYCGIGQSLTGHIKHCKADAIDWGADNLQQVIVFAKENFPDKKLCLLGHSIGGQIIGLAANSVYADRIILIAAQSGYWNLWPGFSKYGLWALWFLFFPLLTKLFGYLPSKSFSKMENLPKNVVEEWSKWCRCKNYLFDSTAPDRLYYDKINCPVSSYSIEDDVFAPKNAVEWLLARYSNANLSRHHIFPNDLKVKKVGHFGIFTKRFHDTFWRSIVTQLR